jgi:hypothetical protein
MEFVADARGKAGHEGDARARLLKLGHDVSSWGTLRIERSILLTGIWRDLGTREEMHTVRYLAHLVPSLEADPWFQERVWSFFDTRRRGRQVANWWGCQNSGKTKTMAIMAIGFGVLHPRRTRQLVSGPFKEAGDSGIWGQRGITSICSQFDRKPESWELGLMKATFDLPPDLIREMKLRAVQEGRKLKDVATEIFRRGLSGAVPAIPESSLQSSRVLIQKSGLPVFRCAPNPPARRLKVRKLLVLEQEAQIAEDLKRAGLPL